MDIDNGIKRKVYFVNLAQEFQRYPEYAPRAYKDLEAAKWACVNYMGATATDIKIQDLLDDDGQRYTESTPVCQVTGKAMAEARTGSPVKLYGYHFHIYELDLNDR